MSKQESMGDWFQMAKDYAKAEKELKIERWVYISIEYKDEGKLEPVRLFSYNLPREVYERRRWVIRWRLSKLPKERRMTAWTARYAWSCSRGRSWRDWLMRKEIKAISNESNSNI